MPPALAVENLSVSYPRRLRAPAVHALVGLDLEVAPGEIVGVLGPNGSGKTTLLRVLAGTQRPTAGSVRILQLAAGARALATRVGYQAEGPLPFPGLCAAEFLGYLGDLMGLPRKLAAAQTDRWLERLELRGAGRRPIATFSAGMARRLSLAAALLANPSVLLLDEPTSALDPRGSLAVVEILRGAAAEGCAILMASHHLQEVEQLCARVYLLDGGRCRAHGTLDELLATDERQIVLRGLDDAGLERVLRAVRDAGGEVVLSGRRREHLFALFRRFER
jgi:ABC-2 type transport system ATP-binding protein